MVDSFWSQPGSAFDWLLFVLIDSFWSQADWLLFVLWWTVLESTRVSFLVTSNLGSAVLGVNPGQLLIGFRLLVVDSFWSQPGSAF